MPGFGQDEALQSVWLCADGLQVGECLGVFFVVIGLARGREDATDIQKISKESFVQLWLK